MFVLAARIAAKFRREEDPRRQFRDQAFADLRRARAQERRSKWLRLIRR
jgi:hypothetical protein